MNSSRTLLCTSTNQTPHERLFNFQRRSVNGNSIPSWLTPKSQVLLRKHVRISKHDPFCEEVEIIEANPSYARVKLNSGHEKTVSLRDIAPLPTSDSDSLLSADTNVNIDMESVIDMSGSNIQSSEFPGAQTPSSSCYKNSAGSECSKRVLDQKGFRENVFKSNSSTKASENMNSSSNDSNLQPVIRRSTRVSVQTEPLNYSKLGGN
jgi:hypothetical protein